jgi:adenine modification enzyme
MKQYIYSSQSSLWGEPELLGFGSNEFYIKEIDRNLANDIIVKNHYSKKYFNNSYIHLGVFNAQEIIGVLQYGHLLNNDSIKNIVNGAQKGDAIELNRMWIADNVGEYPESRAISYSLKYIRRKYPKIKWIQSFADERCGGFGMVYQACSFDYYGEHLSTFYTDGDKFYHNIQVTASREKAGTQVQNKDELEKIKLRQFRYIKFLDQREKKKCLLKQEQYPKYYATT